MARTYRIERSIEIDAPIDELWSLTVDVENLPDLTPTMSRVERLDDGPVAVGSQARIEQPGQRARVWTVTELDRPRRFVWTTRALGMDMAGVHELSTTNGRTTNTVAIELRGALAPVLGPLVKAPIGRALATENDGFKEAAERTTIGPAE